jgi:hypothetical protein
MNYPGMLLTLFFLLSTLFLREEAQEFVLNRIRVTNNVGNQVSVRMHGLSPELILFHAVLRFSSPINQRHNALLIDPSSMTKYSKIVRDDPPKIAVVSRGTKWLLSYHTLTSAEENSTGVLDSNQDGVSDKLMELIRSMSYLGIGAGASGLSYDGILLLDEFSALWDHYNVMSFDRDLLTLSYSANGVLSTREQEPYSGLVRFGCVNDVSSDQCLVESGNGGLVINERFYPDYRLVIDLDSAVNKMPIELFLAWHQEDSSHQITLQLYSSEGGTLSLSPQFHYEVHQSNTLVLGIDLLHYFPKVEYSVTQQQFQLWYFQSAQTDFDTHESVEIFFMFLHFVLLFCLFQWGTSYNYQIANYLVAFDNYAKTAHYFAYKMVIYEGIVMVVASIVVVVSFLFTEEDENFIFHFNGTPYQQRKVLFFFYILYNMLIAILVIALYVEPNKLAMDHYFYGLYSTLLRVRGKRKRQFVKRPTLQEVRVKNDQEWMLNQMDSISPLIQRVTPERVTTVITNETRVDPVNEDPQQPEYRPYASAFEDIADKEDAEALYCEVIQMYHDPVVKLYTPISIIRNMSFITLLLLTMMLLFNFYTEFNNIYLLLIVALSLALIYYQVKYIAVGIVYLSLFQCDSGRVRGNAWLVLFLVISFLVALLYIILTFQPIYITYFNTVNSTLSNTTIVAYVLTVIATLVLASVFMVYRLFDQFVEEIFDDAQDHYRLCHKKLF